MLIGEDDGTEEENRDSTTADQRRLNKRVYLFINLCIVMMFRLQD